MESDWEVEIAPDAPVIDASWDGYINLRTRCDRVNEIREADEFPALAETLIRLNSPSSPVWTAKCDVWPLQTFDPDELEAERDTAIVALGCYIDLLPSNGRTWSTVDASADWCRLLCLRLRDRPVRQCRADLVVRHAFLAHDSTGLGITSYLAACGPTLLEAAAVLSKALIVLADSVLGVGD